MEQVDVFVALGVTAAGATRERPSFAVDHHEQGHWVQVAGFATKPDARAALDRAVSKGIPGAHLRVRSLRRPEH